MTTTSIATAAPTPDPAPAPNAAPPPAEATGARPDGAPGGLRAAFETRTGRRLLVLAVWATLCFAAMILTFVVSRLAPAGMAGSVAPNDFSAFWAAARMAGEIGPVAVLDPEALAPAQLYAPRAEGVPHYFPFLYPPAWLAMALPLGQLDFALAYPLFAALGLGAFVAAACLVAPPGAPAMERRTLGLVAAGALLHFAQVLSGQLTLLWVAWLMASLALAERDRPVAAGLVLGLLSIKPTLCLLLPVAIIASGDRRYVASAAVSVALVALLPTLWTGIGYWEAWLAALAEQGARVAASVERTRAMMSWYAALSGAGVEHATATALQAVVSLGAAAAVIAAWWRARTPFAARAGLLLIAIPLASPYAWYYELAVVLAGMLYLLRAGWGRGPVAWGIFMIVWALGGFLPFLSDIVEFRFVMAPVVTLAFLAALAETGLLGPRAARVLG